MLSLILLLVVTVYFISSSKGGQYEIFGVVDTTIFVKEVGGDPVEWQATYTIMEDTVLKDRKGNLLSFQDLETGQIVMIKERRTAVLLTSNPPRLGADEVIVIK